MKGLKSLQLKPLCFEAVLTEGPVDRGTETEERFLARSLARVFSAMSALSSASSNSCCTLRYLAKFTAAISSCKQTIVDKPEFIKEKFSFNFICMSLLHTIHRTQTFRTAYSSLECCRSNKFCCFTESTLYTSLIRC